MTTTQDAPAAAAPQQEIGRDRRRKEDQRLITGRTKWTDNIQITGMLHLAMVRSPFAHAKITHIDVSEAKAARKSAKPAKDGKDKPAKAKSAETKPAKKSKSKKSK